MSYSIVTKVLDDGVIQQSIKSNPKDEYLSRLSKLIIDTREKQIIKALISLGWTPPDIVFDFEKLVGYCYVCGRQTGHEELATNCDMTQPDGTNYPGEIIPKGTLKR